MKEFKIGDHVAIGGCPIYLIITKIDKFGYYHLKTDLNNCWAYVMTPSELNKSYV